MHAPKHWVNKALAACWNTPVCKRRLVPSIRAKPTHSCNRNFAAKFSCFCDSAAFNLSCWLFFRFSVKLPRNSVLAQRTQLDASYSLPGACRGPFWEKHLLFIAVIINVGRAPRNGNSQFKIWKWVLMADKFFHLKRISLFEIKLYISQDDIVTCGDDWVGRGQKKLGNTGLTSWSTITALGEFLLGKQPLFCWNRQEVHFLCAVALDHQVFSCGCSCLKFDQKCCHFVSASLKDAQSASSLHETFCNRGRSTQFDDRPSLSETVK